MTRFVFSVLFLAFVLVLLLGTQQSFGADEISEKAKKQCETKYESYKQFGFRYLEQKYPHISYLDKCLDLYEDPNWSFNGKERIDKFYEKQSMLNSNAGIKIRSYENQNLGVQKLRTISIDLDNYVVKVRMCLNGMQISEPKFFVVTDKEYFLALGNIIVKENSCSLATIYVNAQNPENLKFFSFNGNYIPSKYMTIKSIY